MRSNRTFRITAVDGSTVAASLPESFSLAAQRALPRILSALGIVQSGTNWVLVPTDRTDHLLCVPSSMVIGQQSAEDPRRKRLRSEWARLQQMHQETDHVVAKPLVELEGAIPDRYEITFRCRGIVGIEPETRAPIYGNEHRMEVYCGAEFPDRPPKLTWLTDIYHPNISRSLGVCTNAKEWLADMGVDEICYQVFEMIQYQNYFIDNQPPYPLDWDAAAWVRDYAEPKGIVNREKEIFVGTTQFYKSSVPRELRIKRLGTRTAPLPAAASTVADGQESRRIRIGPRREAPKPQARRIRVRS